MNIKSIAVTTSENFDTDIVYVLTEDNQIFYFVVGSTNPSWIKLPEIPKDE